MILIDFIDMKSEMDRNSVMHTLATELKKDDRQHRIIGFTALGILQLTRKKTKVSISEVYWKNVPYVKGLGKVPSAETIVFRLERELFEYRYKDFDQCNDSMYRRSERGLLW